jgi:hypothetical protein
MLQPLLFGTQPKLLNLIAPHETTMPYCSKHLSCCYPSPLQKGQMSYTTSTTRGGVESSGLMFHMPLPLPHLLLLLPHRKQQWLCEPHSL